MHTTRRLALAAAFTLAATWFAPGTVVAGATPYLGSFVPASVSFPSPKDGWVLGTLVCAGAHRCLALLRTSDAGRSWVKAPLSSRIVKEADLSVLGNTSLTYGSGLNVRFANRDDGWIYGELPVTVHDGKKSYQNFEMALWATHDGGRTWSSQKLKGAYDEGEVFDVEAARGTVYVLAQTYSGALIDSSPVSKNRWRSDSDVALNGPAGGAEPGGWIVLKGSTGWLVEGNDRGTTGSARLSSGRWVAWRPPCASVGHGLAVPAAANVKDLVAVCGMGGFAYPMPKAAPPGATIGSSWLYTSSNGGMTFTVGTEIHPVQANDSFGEFPGVLASPSPGDIVLGRLLTNEGPADLIASHDGGVHWSVVYRGHLSFIAFSSPEDGAGLVMLTGASHELIRTVDGGLHWSAVNF